MNSNTKETLEDFNHPVELIFQLGFNVSHSKLTAFSFRAQSKTRHISAAVFGRNCHVRASFLKTPRNRHLMRLQHLPRFLPRG